MRYSLFVLALGATFTAAQARDEMPMDQPVTISGIETVCTGIGSAQDDPRWKAYPVRLEFSNKAHEYLTDADVVLAKADGTQLSSFFCPAAWVLFKLPAGPYKVTATVENSTASAAFSAPAKGQKRVIVFFGGAGTH